MNAAYPFISDIAVDVVSQEKVASTKWYRVLIKLESACVYGHDMAQELPDLKPGEDTRISSPALKRRVERTLRALETVEDENEIKIWCRGITRRMVRSAYELVEEQEGVYTRELEKCAEGFAQYYPKHAQAIQEALTLTRTPIHNKQHLISFLEKFGKWLIDEVDRKFGVQLL